MPRILPYPNYQDTFKIEDILTANHLFTLKIYNYNQMILKYFGLYFTQYIWEYSEKNRSLKSALGSNEYEIRLQNRIAIHGSTTYERGTNQINLIDCTDRWLVWIGTGIQFENYKSYGLKWWTCMWFLPNELCRDSDKC